MTSEARLLSSLPEKYALLYDYHTGRFETPLDDRGIVDIDALFELAIHTYPEQLPDLNSSGKNIHHVYRPERYWLNLAASLPREDAATVLGFRNSTPQLAYVPRPIHAWIERITIPPPAPTLETMRRRNAAWGVARILIRSAILLDQARNEYGTKKDSTRQVLGYIEGVTPRSRHRNFDIESCLNREYWLSELNHRLDGWRCIAGVVEEIPDEDRIIVEPRLASVRALKRRIRNGAIVPRMPELIAA